jgi:hypothetical protein
MSREKILRNPAFAGNKDGALERMPHPERERF